MPAKETKPKTGGRTAAEVDEKLPNSYFVKRGHIMAAFELTRADMDALVPDIFKPEKNAKFIRARFVRSQVMTVARQWERRA